MIDFPVERWHVVITMGLCNLSITITHIYCYITTFFATYRCVLELNFDKQANA
jgi:hypothetical protein